MEAVNDFVLFTDVSALDSLATDGAGSLYGDPVDTVRKAIYRLLVPIVHPALNNSLPLLQAWEWPK